MTTGNSGAEIIQIKRAYSQGEKRRAAKLIKAGRPRENPQEREANGRASRRKQYQPPEVSWYAPSIKRGLNMHPTVALEVRGAITSDQCRAAHSWVGDRMKSGLPYTAPSSLDLDRVRGPAGEPADEIRGAEANRRYNDLHSILAQRCGVYGRDLAYRTIIQGEQDEAVAQYWHRVGAKMDPTPRQILAWQHLKLAFAEIESFYAFVVKKRLERRSEAA